MKIILRFRNLLSRRVSGMTLVELLLVLALIGILLSLAVPKLMPLIAKTKSLEAQMQLKHLLSLQKSYYYVNSRYSDNLSDVGFEQTKLVSEGGKANYRIEIANASQSSFVARAIAVSDFDQDGQYSVWSINQDEELSESVSD